MPIPTSAMRVAVELDEGADGGDRPVAGAALDLLVGAAGAGADRARGPRRGSRHRRPPSRTARRGTRRSSTVRVPVAERMTAVAPQGGEHGGEILGRVGLAERPADRAPVAHERVGDDPLGLGEDAVVLGQQRRVEHGGMARHRPDSDLVAVELDVVEVGQAVDVDERLGAGQPELHHRQQAVASRQQPSVRSVAGEQRDRPRRRCPPARTRTEAELARATPSPPGHAAARHPPCRGNLRPVSRGVNGRLTDRLSSAPGVVHLRRDPDPARGVRAGGPAGIGQGGGRHARGERAGGLRGTRRAAPAARRSADRQDSEPG